MPTIRISDDTWQRLKAWAVPLEDTPDDAVGKVLDVAEGKTSKEDAKPQVLSHKPKIKPRLHGSKLPQKEFRIPLMKVLYELGGSASTKDLQKVMGERMKLKLSEADYDKVSSGEVRWWNAICWERNDLVKEGLFRQNSERGTWELSKSGLKFIESNLTL